MVLGTLMITLSNLAKSLRGSRTLGLTECKDAKAHQLYLINSLNG